MNFTSEEWRALILVPLVVSIVANLLTPVVWRGVVAGAVGLARGLHFTAKSGTNLRIRQLTEEIELMQNLSSNHLELLKHYRFSVFFLGLCLWLVLLSPVLGLALSWLTAHFAPYLPRSFGVLYSDPKFAMAAGVGSVLAAGPIQAAIHFLYLNRRLGQLAKDGPGLIATLEAKRERLRGAVNG